MKLSVIWESLAAELGITKKLLRDFRTSAEKAGEDPDVVLAQFFRDSVSECGQFCRISRMSEPGWRPNAG